MNSIPGLQESRGIEASDHSIRRSDRKGPPNGNRNRNCCTRHRGTAKCSIDARGTTAIIITLKERRTRITWTFILTRNRTLGACLENRSIFTAALFAYHFKVCTLHTYKEMDSNLHIQIKSRRHILVTQYQMVINDD